MTPSMIALNLLARSYSATSAKMDARLGAMHGIGFGDYLLLEAIAAGGGRQKPTDLARALHLTPSGVTRALIPLEKIGLVRRERTDRDARVSYAVLTGASEALLNHARTTAREAADRMTEHLNNGELETLHELLARLA
jgi:DNA-binding MarR family transcriptional regulator